MKIPEGLKCEITPEMAYNWRVPEIPEGFEVLRFGHVKASEMYLNHDGDVISASSDHAGWPLIIIRKKPEPPRQMRSPSGGYVHDERDDCEKNGCVPICDPKHITRQRVDELARRYGPQLPLMTVGNFITTVLRSLGVEVQD